jgi:hypothetical protein
MIESNIYDNYFLLDKKIEVFCKGVGKLLDNIHDRCGDVEIVAYSFLPSKNILKLLKH